MNGSGLPYTAIFIASPPYRLEILDDQVVANADGTYTETGHYRETDGTTVTTSVSMDAGSWSQHGNQIDITSSADGSVNTAVVSGNKLTVNAQGSAAVYVRQ